MKKYLFTSVMLIMMTMMGCRTQANLSSEHHSDYQHDTHTEQHTTHASQHDTVHVLDSVRVCERNDTTYISRIRTEWHERTIEKTDTLLLTDTVQIAVCDTIYQRASPTPKDEGEATWYYWLLAGNILVVLGFILRFFWRRR